MPLLERVRFCSIFSSHLDEFFMVRVAGLRGQEDAGVGTRSPDGRTPSEALAEIRERALELTRGSRGSGSASSARRSPRRESSSRRSRTATRASSRSSKRRFERQIFPVLTPLAVGPGQPFPYISGLSLSLGLFVRDPETGEERFARVKVPELLPRFLPRGQARHPPPARERDPSLPAACSSRRWRSSSAPASASRANADFEVSDEADDLLEAVELELQRRRFGEVVRLEVAGSASSRMLTPHPAGRRRRRRRRRSSCRDCSTSSTSASSSTFRAPS